MDVLAIVSLYVIGMGLASIVMGIRIVLDDNRLYSLFHRPDMWDWARLVFWPIDFVGTIVFFVVRFLIEFLIDLGVSIALTIQGQIEKRKRNR